ncbi:MAG: hypothetical protein JAY64_10595 [Candidatus Thiodiazotropha weberae]|nr:hypothetical protein [Candidatus Thiodiazotropha lotti]MCG8012135.1 hypothetical protein [Candidatus Thiodiazotropha lotti]MCW4211603.1 hypothetical protein [Candidatus Thiodiazotropha lotti]MCW4214570.1 hypothetical protein [Candidatus Thiodiazotropha lotti]
MPQFILSDKPDWSRAAQRLVSGCKILEDLNQRIALMEKVCDSLGDELYPAFLKILCIIGKNGDHDAKQLITETLVEALLTGRLPSGRMSAWGAESARGSNLFGQTRSLGPIEYVFTWYAQPSGRSPLPIQSFHHAASELLELISSNPKAKKLYCTKLTADIEDPLDGSLSRKSRYAIGNFVEAWEADKSTDEVLSSFLDTLLGDSLSRLVNIQSQFTF